MKRAGWIGLALGILVGLVGGLVYTWYIDPVVNTDTQPWQLDSEGQARYIAAISLAYAQDGDLETAVDRLLSVRRDSADPFQQVADTACLYVQRGMAGTESGLTAINSMCLLYQGQGRTGCADPICVQESTPRPTPTRVTVTLAPTREPTATRTPRPTILLDTVTPSDTPTPTPPGDFYVVLQNAFCNAETPGTIRVYVQNRDGTGVPGAEILVTWGQGARSRFFTGLKPEVGAGYADFVMEEQGAYRLEMPGRSEAVTLTAETCTPDDPDPEDDESPAPVLTSYEVVFRR